MSKRSENREPETRSGRNRKDNNQKEKKVGLEKIYYIIIAVLLVILAVILIFIFSNRGDNVENVTDEAGQTEVVEESAGENSEQQEESQPEENQENTEEETEPSEEGQEAEEEEEDSEQDGETTVEEDAPLDSSYVPDYSDGSADRVQIAALASEVTGIPRNDMIEVWVGNNGPGRVRAEVRNTSGTEHYYVYLQYGEGSWSVTGYEPV